jgi:hypothetical protein
MSQIYGDGEVKISIEERFANLDCLVVGTRDEARCTIVVLQESESEKEERQTWRAITDPL